MAAFQSRDPQLAARLMNLVESGLSADEVARALVEDNVARSLSATEGSTSFAEETEVFADEIKVIAQALAYRAATDEDLDEVTKLLDAAYFPEMIESGSSESFRNGGPEAVAPEAIEALFRDPSYSWQVVEAPSGRGVERDGVILGACCYSTDGVSRKNGQVEGKLGSLRFFGVLPRFHGVCVGRRLLHRVELLMTQAGCVRSMACVPSTRTKLHAWLERRGYNQAGASPYPFGALGHSPAPATVTTAGDVGVQLCVFVRPLHGAASEADGKTTKKTLIQLSPTVTAAAAAAATDGKDKEPALTSSVRDGQGQDQHLPPLPNVPGKMHLPPQWRGYTDKDIAAAAAAAAAGGGGGGGGVADGKGGGDDGDDDELGVD